MKIEKVSINGKVFLPRDAKVSAVSKNIVNGLSIFESFRVSDNKAFQLEEHFDRLAKNLKAIGLNWDDKRSKYYKWISELCVASPADKDAFVRFTINEDEGELGVVKNESAITPQVIMYLSYIPKFAPTEKRGFVLENVRREKTEYSRAVGFRIKNLNYLFTCISAKELEKTASKYPGSASNLSKDGILLSPEGYIAEALRSNVFWSKKDKLYTPSLKTNILAGTMREYLIKNNSVEEVLAPTEELESADEIFLTSGASYLVALNEIDGIKKPGTNGKVFKKLYQGLTQDIEESSKELV